MKIRASTKIAIGVVTLGVTTYFGYQAVAAWQVDREKFNPIAPGEVNLVAISPEAGYSIIVANRIAQLGELSDPSQLKNRNFDPDKADVTNRKRIPMRELLECLQGKEEAVGPMVMAMNNLNKDDLPPDGAVWKAEDLRKALDGDQALAQKLQRQVNANLDGTFPSFVSQSAVFGGLILDLPVTVTVQVAGKTTQLTGRIQEEFRTTAMSQVASRFEQENVTVSDATLVKAYTEVVRRVEKNGGNDLRTGLEARLDKERLQGFARSPERVLANAQVVLNDNFITSARVEEVKVEGKDSTYTIYLDLTKEGRLRLWQFSRGRTGFQLLFIVNGIAIAAPIISKELPFKTITISRLKDRDLAQSAVDTIENILKSKSSQGETR